jgi:XRE family transcriptional regulator, fatty acid utilization regulator
MGELAALAGKRLRAERKAAGWTLAELGAAVGLSVAYVSELERGLGAMTLGHLEAFASALSVSPYALLDVAEDERNRRLWYQATLRRIRALLPADIEGE